MNTETTLSWQDNSTTETEFKIYYRIQEPNAPTNLIASNINTSGVTLNWQDNSTNESGFKVYYRT
jgi:predicted transcriptional regulator